MYHIDMGTSIKHNKTTFLTFFICFVVWFSFFFLMTNGFKFGHFMQWLAPFYRWDSELYEAIWRNGYLNVNQKSLAYPPLYPYFVGLVSIFIGDFHFSAALLNMICFFISGLLFVYLTSRQFQISKLALSIIYLSSLTNYFIFSVYSDSVFIFFVWVLIFLLVSRPKIKYSEYYENLILLALPWLRIIGVSLIVLRFNKVKNSWIVLFSFLFFLFLQFYITGDFFAFLHVQQSHFAMPEGHFLNGLNYSFSRLLEFSDPWYLHMIVFPSFYFVSIFSASLWFWFKGHKNYALIMLGFLLMSHNMAFWRSSVRYDWFSMPLIFIPMLVGAKKSRVKIFYYLAIVGLVSVQLYYQIKFANDFTKGLWAF